MIKKLAGVLLALVVVTLVVRLALLVHTPISADATPTPIEAPAP